MHKYVLQNNMHQEDTLTLVSTWTQIDNVSCEARVAQKNAHQCSAYSNIYSNTLHKIQNACVAGFHGLHQEGARFRSQIEPRLIMQIQLRQLLFILLFYLTIICWGTMHLTGGYDILCSYSQKCDGVGTVDTWSRLVINYVSLEWQTSKNVFLEYVRFHFSFLINSYLDEQCEQSLC